MICSERTMGKQRMQRNKEFGLFTKPSKLKDRGPLLAVVLKLGVFSAKPFNAAGGIHQFLFACIKRMALGADFHRNVGFSGSYGHFIAAGAFNGRRFIFGMNIFFHRGIPFL
jgi:hypothetical protein